MFVNLSRINAGDKEIAQIEYMAILTKFFCSKPQSKFNPLIAFSVICLLSPDHNWHIYVL